MAQQQTADAAFTGLMNLASDLVGAKAIACSDDFFASMDCMVSHLPAIFEADRYTDRGKWMDGWESRRKRSPGHDWCIVKLGVVGELLGVDIDTAFFLGNHPPYASIEACLAPENATPEELSHHEWTEILGSSALKLGSHNYFALKNQEKGPFSHVKLRIYPDGGVARLRVYGQPKVEKWEGEGDLLSALKGGKALACSDSFFGVMHHLLLPQVAKNMGEGWESRRRRGPGNDWVIVELGQPGEINRLTIDTKHFKGNYPDRCMVEGICWPNAPITSLMSSDQWEAVLPESRLRADFAHEFDQLKKQGPFTHLRLSIYPCGGVSRLRAWGKTIELKAEHCEHPLVKAINQMDQDTLKQKLLYCCHSQKWVSQMLKARPFVSYAELMGKAQELWWKLDPQDWEEAFTGHPQIGQSLESIRQKYAQTSDWATQEQAGMNGASEEIYQALAQKNQEYFAKYGFIFIICATGKTAVDMLNAIDQRMAFNDLNFERAVAAGEQNKITQLRLNKLI
jgi:allantoicase